MICNIYKKKTLHESYLKPEIQLPLYLKNNLLNINQNAATKINNHKVNTSVPAVNTS